MPTPNLAGLLAKPRPVLKAPAQTDSAVVPQPEAIVQADGNDSAAPAELVSVADDGQLSTSGKPSSAQDSGDQRQYLRSITIYTPRSVHRTVGLVAGERKTTRTALILAALNATHQQIGKVLTSSKATAGDRDLFAVPQSRVATEPSVQTTIRVTDSQFDAIENLVAEHATNRSRLVTAALQKYLPSPAK
jgi:chemotaxis protein histidine kinase CheA